MTVARLRAIARVEEAEPVRPSANGVFEDTDKIHLDQASEMGVAASARLTDRVNRLVAALRRMETGEHGKCVECGASIVEARLRALPEVETCIACQAEIERRTRMPSEAEFAA